MLIGSAGASAVLMNPSSLLRCFRTTALGCLLSLGAHGSPGNGLYERAGMKELDFPSLRVWLGRPVQVTAQIGWGMNWVHPGWQPGWSFVHLTPYLAKFPGGNLIATYTMDPDTQQNPFFLSAFQISRDGGAHWGR